MALSFRVAVVLMTVLAGASPGGSPVDIFEIQAPSHPRNKIDELVFARLASLDLQPSNPCSDSTFVRRAYLDVIGTLPAATKVADFLADESPSKRTALIDQLLERKEFADYRAMKWADLLRVKAEFPINLWPNAAQAYYRWIHDSLRENKPYEQFVRELLTSSGSNFRIPPVNFYRAVQSQEPQAITDAVILTLMGERSEKWSRERLDGMSPFFSYIGFKRTKEWKEEVVFFDLEKALKELSEESPMGVFPDGTSAKLTPGRDPRAVFADWFIQPENPWFARTIVNRVWCWLLGRGIVHEPDDFRPDNPPSHPGLLALLEQELVAAKYDLKHIYRLILNSATYQLSSVPRSEDPRAVAYFATYPVRRLEAEVLVDALCQITGTTEKYSSAIPEPFTFIPEKQRSIALADGSITSPFLEMFGRPPRDSGLGMERNNAPSPAQRLHMLNSSHVQRKLRQGSGLKRVIVPNRRPDDMARDLYLLILSRYPTAEESKTIREYAESSVAQNQEDLHDLAWALINSSEFLHRH